MPVYFIQAGESGPVKIGYGANPHRRLHNLQLGCPDKLRLLGVVDGAEEQEREFHQQYASRRLRGEWFNVPADELPKLRQLRPSHNGMRKPTTAIGEWMEINGVADAAMVERLDVKIDRSTISRVRRGKQRPSPSLIESIARLTNGQVPPNSFFDVAEAAAE